MIGIDDIIGYARYRLVGQGVWEPAEHVDWTELFDGEILLAFRSFQSRLEGVRRAESVVAVLGRA